MTPFSALQIKNGSPLKEVLAPELGILNQSLQIVAEETDGFLGDLLSYVLKGSGKRIRPALVFLTSQLGRSKLEAVRTVAMAVELIHIATLIHDDIIDKAALRRGGKTVVEREGTDSALLLGDYIFTYAYKKVASLNEPLILQLLAEATYTVCDGEINQLKRRFQFDLSEGEYFSFIRKKTASLFGASARCGAILAGQPLEIQESLERFGINLGVAFQIRDDLLDLTANEKDIGKTLRTDILNGKMTLPLILFREEKRGQVDFDYFFGLLKSPNGQLESLLNDVRKSGAIEGAMDVVEKQIKAAKDELSGLPSERVRAHLDDLSDFLLKRNF